MAKGSQELEQQFIASARDKTGHDVPEWMAIIEAAGLDPKPNTILKWLKETHNLNHMQANFLSGIYLNDGKPVFDYEVLFQKLFEGKADLLPVYAALKQEIQAALPEAEFIPTKTYISIEGAKIFACATLTKKTIRVGLDLGNTPFDGVVQKAKGLGAMPNLSHMIEIESAADVSAGLVNYVQQAYQRVHSK